MSEHFNNDVIARWEKEQDEQRCLEEEEAVAIRFGIDIPQRVRELEEQWVMGNRKHVVDTILEQPTTPAIALIAGLSQQLNEEGRALLVTCTLRRLR